MTSLAEANAIYETGILRIQGAGTAAETRITVCHQIPDGRGGFGREVEKDHLWAQELRFGITVNLLID